MQALLKATFEPGFFSSATVLTAVVVGGVAAAVSGVVGTFTVMRGQSFAGHALADISSAGGSASFLLGINPLLGFLSMAAVAAGGMEAAGTRRVRGRDVETGIVLGAGLGAAALFLYFNASTTSTTGTAITVMFGSMFAIPSSTIPLVSLLSVVALATVFVLYRPLLLVSASSELAAASGVRVRLMELVYLLALAVAVSLSALTVGAILATALLIGPGAAALRVTKRPGLAVVAAALIGLGTTWIGILLAYDSYYWTSGHRGWPVSFFVVTLVFAAYLLAGGARPCHRRRRGPAPAAPAITPAEA
ncbi:MAG: metal ABC transporter permease [Acidimicrobiales bacterium]